MNELQSYRKEYLKIDKTFERKSHMLQAIKKGKIARMKREKYNERNMVQLDKKIFILPSYSHWLRRIYDYLLKGDEECFIIEDNYSVNSVMKIINSSHNVVFLFRIPSVCKTMNTFFKSRNVILIPMTYGLDTGKLKVNEIWAYSQNMFQWVSYSNKFNNCKKVAYYIKIPKQVQVHRINVKPDDYYLHIMNDVSSHTDLLFNAWYSTRMQYLSYTPKLLILGDIPAFFAIYQLFRSSITRIQLVINEKEIPSCFLIEKYNIYVSFHSYSIDELTNLTGCIKALIQPNKDDPMGYFAYLLKCNLISSNDMLGGYKIKNKTEKNRISCKYKNMEMYFHNQKGNEYPYTYSDEYEILKKIFYIETNLVKS